MPRYILAVLLIVELIPQAHSASIIGLLTQKCVQTQVTPITATNIATQTPDEIAVKLERQVIGLFNFDDSVKFYRRYHLKSDEQNALLQCQLHLAEQFSQLFKRQYLTNLSNALLKSEQPDTHAFGNRLRQLKEYKLTPKQKSIIHSSQVGIEYGLRNQALSLVIEPSNCQLADTATTSTSRANFDKTIAGYLLKQKSSHCKQQVWQTYQLRAKAVNHAHLTRLINLKNDIAKQRGFSDYTSFILSHQQLQSAVLVGQYLDTLTRPTVAPWEIGTSLSKASKTPVISLSTTQMFKKVYAKLAPFGIHVDIINDHLHRIWYQKRLLGDIDLSEGKHIEIVDIRQGVIGQQYGQIAIISPRDLKTYRSQRQLIGVMAQGIFQLLKSGRYYLVNTLANNQDNALVGQYWLTLYLSHQLLPPLKSTSRDAVFARFSTQMKVFKSKLALSAYQFAKTRRYHNFQKEFARSFGEQWSQASDAIYSFSAIAQQGPLYYQSLWQQSLARLIFKTHEKISTQREIFDTLLVNDKQLTIDAQLQQLFGHPVSARALIKMVQ